MTIEASETDLSITDVPGNEVFPIEELGEFRVRLCNGVGSNGDKDKKSCLWLWEVKGTGVCEGSLIIHK